MVSGRTPEGHGEPQVTIRRLPANKSQSSISIPAVYNYQHINQGNQGTIPLNTASTSSSSSTAAHQFYPHGAERRDRNVGPGNYHRTHSSSSLLHSGDSHVVSKSRSDYCTTACNTFQPSSQRTFVDNYAGSGSSSNIYFQNVANSDFCLLSNEDCRSSGHVGGGEGSKKSESNGRDYRERRLIRESSQPIIIHVPITAPKATATTLSRATSPPPPQYYSSLLSTSSSSSSSPKRTRNTGGGGGKKGNDGKREKEICSGGEGEIARRKKKRRYNNVIHHDLSDNTLYSGDDDIDDDGSENDNIGDCQKELLELKVTAVTARTSATTATNTLETMGGREKETKILIEKQAAEEGLHLVGKKKRVAASEVASTTASSPNLVKYCQNAPLKKVTHPLEENIFSSLLLTLVAVGAALVIGIPVLFLFGTLLVGAVIVRYSIFVLHGCYSYLRFLCLSRRHLSRPTTSPPPTICPMNRLAFANDVRWMGRRNPKQCQSILQTVLVFEGSMDLGNLRHLVQTRVVHAETPEGELTYPRLMHKLIAFPAGYRWELDVGFDIQNHIFAGPSHIRTESQIQEYVGRLLTESLTMGKPLWEIRVITNYGSQKDTLAILRVHQCLADGMSLVRILSHSLADQQQNRQMHIPQRPHFAGLSFGFNVLRSLIVGPLTFFMWVLTTIRDRNLFSIPLHAGKKHKTKAERRKNNRHEKDGGGRGDTGGSGAGESCYGSPSQLQAMSPSTATKNRKKEPKVKARQNKGRKRKKKKIPVWNAVWSAPVSVAKVGRVKQITRSSLNDVMLSAVAGSIRQYLQKSGIPCPDDVKVVIPIDLRNDVACPKRSTKLGCKVASALAQIPSGMEGAIPRLWATRHRLDELKASADPVVAYGATTVLMNILPLPLGTAVLGTITDKASLQFSNLPGPTHTLVIGGFPLKGIYPIYPPCGKIRVAISVFSYADQVHISIVSHRSLINAGPSLLQGINSQLDQLSKQLSQRRVPGESRRSTRNASVNNNPEIAKPPIRQIHMQLQVVQEELQQLSHRLDVLPESEKDSRSFSCEKRPQENITSSEESLGGYATAGPANVFSATVAASSGSPGQAQLRTRMKTLKTEFSELMGELRRRSSIVEGVQMSFEDEECEDDFRKPRKRALSVVSMSMSRRNSLFSSKSFTNSESSGCYPSEDEDLPSSPSHEVRMYSRPSTSIASTSASLIHQSASPIRTTAV